MAPPDVPDAPTVLLRENHLAFVDRLYRLAPDSLESLMTQHIRINGIYWALTSLHILGEPDRLPRAQVVAEVLACRDPDTGGFGSAPGHDPHVVATLHAVQILRMLGAMENLDRPGRTVRYLASLQGSDGAFRGDVWGEVDMRLNYAATQALSLLLPPLQSSPRVGGHSARSGEQDEDESEERPTDLRTVMDVAALRSYVLRCRNFDGGFGSVPGGESHAAHVFTSLGTLAILAQHDHHSSTTTITTTAGTTTLASSGVVDVSSTAWWLSCRQLRGGGLNGRPEKLADTCYGWWVLASLAMLGKMDWISGSALRVFILAAQDDEGGGISDRPGDEADVYHTCFGLAGLALLREPGLWEIDPRYCLPLDLTRRLFGSP